METIKDAVMVLMVLKGFVWVLMEIVVVSTVMSLILLVYILEQRLLHTTNNNLGMFFIEKDIGL